MLGSNEAWVSRRRDLVPQLIERVSDRQLGRHLGDREAGRLDARAEERDTRGFISITTCARLRIDGELHVDAGATPISRSTRSPRRRMIWYSLVRQGPPAQVPR